MAQRYWLRGKKRKGVKKRLILHHFLAYFFSFLVLKNKKVDKNDPKKGILELVPVDPLKIKKIRKIEKEKGGKVELLIVVGLVTIMVLCVVWIWVKV